MRDRTVGETFYMYFTTRAFATGIPTVLAGTPVVSAYEDGSITQITAGITLGVDHDGVAGLNLLTIVATGANGYEAGKDYSLVITTGTVGGVSVVGEVVGEFSLGLSAAFTRLGAPTGASVVADIATAQADLDIITDTDGVVLGAAGVDLVWDEVIVGAHNTNNSSGKMLRLLKEAGGYTGGRIYINPNGTAGTTDYENGTDSNPVTTLADALTLSASLNINDFYVTRDATLAPAADFTNKTVFGNGYAFTLGGHDYAGTHIYHASPVTGTATTAGNSDHFDLLDCIIGNITVDDAHLTRCILTGTITLSGVGSGTPGELKMIDCWSGVAGASTPILDFGTGSENHNVTIGNYNNGLEIQNFNVATTGGTDLLSISGTGQLIISSECQGTVNLRGQWKITNNAGANVTITQDDVATSVIAIEADTNELQGDWADAGRLDTILDSILTDTGTTLQGELDAIQAAVITNAAGTDIAADIIALDAVADAIKAVTDQFVFTNANQVDANTLAINSATVVGDGNAVPWDGA